MGVNKSNRGYITSTMGCRCPRCREGKLFSYPVSLGKKNLEMKKNCEVCGQPTEIEVGFYYGTGYVSYALAIAITVTSFITWFVLIGMSTSDNRFFYWLGTNSLLLIILQPWMMRLSRSIWISWFVKYDPEWERHQPVDVSERLNPDQANNW